MNAKLVKNPNTIKEAMQTEGGFTILELLVVITLISISIGITSDILVSLTRSYNKTSVTNEIEQQANFVGLKIEKELRNATNVTATPTQLSFEIAGTTICYRVITSGSYTNIYRATGSCPTGTTAQALLATPTITGTALGLTMTCPTNCFIVTGNSPQVVDLDMVFSQAAGGGTSFSGNVVLKNTIVIRNTY